MQNYTPFPFYLFRILVLICHKLPLNHKISDYFSAYTTRFTINRHNHFLKFCHLIACIELKVYYFQKKQNQNSEEQNSQHPIIIMNKGHTHQHKHSLNQKSQYIFKETKKKFNARKLSK